MLFSCNLFASSHSLIWFVCGTRVAPARFMNGGNPCNINALGRQPHDASHARGRRFESASLHQSLENAVFSRDFPFSLKKVRPLAFFAIFEESRRSDFL